MAALLQILVAPATQAQFDELDAAVGEAMTRAGGPPQGLMSHVVDPEADGFVVADVWRQEAEGHGFVDTVLRLLLADLGLVAREIRALPVWSFAQP